MLEKIDIGKRLKFFRESNNLSQKELSNELKIFSRSTLSYLENGEREMTVNELIKICDYFNIPIDYFLDVKKDNYMGINSSLLEQDFKETQKLLMSISKSLKNIRDNKIHLFKSKKVKI